MAFRHRKQKFNIGGDDGKVEVFELGSSDGPRPVDRPDVALKAHGIFSDAVETAGGTTYGTTDIGGGLSIVNEPGQPLRLVSATDDEA